MLLNKLVKLFLPDSIADRLKQGVNDRRDMIEWINYQRNPRIPPPHILKVKTVIEYSRRYGIQVLIETGTFEGEMVRKCRHHFREIYTVELDEHLSRRATKRLAKFGNIHVIHDDSSGCLPRLLTNIKEPVLFWLDAHFSEGETAKGDKETPILEELEAIRLHGTKQHVILIDDARLFGQGDYPSAEALSKKLLLINPKYKIEILADIMRCGPN